MYRVYMFSPCLLQSPAQAWQGMASLKCQDLLNQGPEEPLFLGRLLDIFDFPLLGLRGPYLLIFFRGFKLPTSVLVDM